MKFLSVLLLAGALSAPLAYAQGSNCHCGPKKCDMECAKHKTKTCECKEGCKHKDCHYQKKS